MHKNTYYGDNMEAHFCNICGTRLIQTGDISYCPVCTIKGEDYTIDLGVFNDEVKKQFDDFITLILTNDIHITDVVTFVPLLLAGYLAVQDLNDVELNKFMNMLERAVRMNYIHLQDVKHNANI